MGPLKGLSWHDNATREWEKRGKPVDETPKGLVTAQTQAKLDDTTRPKFDEVLEKSGFEKVYGHKVTKRTKSLIRFDNNTEIIFRSAFDPNVFQGWTLDWAMCDEAGLYDSRFYNNLKSRLQRRNGKAVFPTTPYDFNWLYRDIWFPIMEKGREVPRTEIINWRTEDNWIWEKNAQGHAVKTYNFDRDFLAEQKKNLSPDEYSRRFCGIYSHPTNLVYPKWDDSVMIIKDKDMPYAFDEVILAIDFGQMHPCGIVPIGLVQRDDETVDWYCIDEYSVQHLPVTVDLASREWSMEKQVKVFNGIYSVDDWYADQEDPDSMSQLIDRGIYVQSFDKSKNCIRESNWMLNSLMIQGHFFVSERCVGLIKQIRDASHKIGPDDLPSDEVEKGNDDLIDPVRSGIFSHKGLHRTKRSLSEPGRKIDWSKLLKTGFTPEQLEKLEKNGNTNSSGRYPSYI